LFSPFRNRTDLSFGRENLLAENSLAEKIGWDFGPVLNQNGNLTLPKI